jgi:O-antigen/teichoic acid export membrane protein
MSVPVVEIEKRGFRAPGTGVMVAGSLVGAVGAYLFQWYGARVLSPTELAPISALWTLFFILVTILLVPVEQYVTREVTRGRKAIPHDLGPAAVMSAIGAILGIVYVISNYDTLFASDPRYLAQIVALVVAYALLFVGKGILAGSRRFALVGWVMVIESIGRLLVGVLFLWLVLDATSMGWAMVVGALLVLAVGWWRYDAGTVKDPASPAGAFLLGYVGGTSSSQMLLAGAPLAVGMLGGSPALVSIVFITFTLYRAPLTLIFSLQGRVLPYLVGLSHAGDHRQLSRIARRVVLGGAALAILGGLVGWWVGADVVAILYGAEYRPSTIVATLAAAGVMAAASAQIASQVLVAEGRTRRLGMAWLGGLLTAVVVAVLVTGEPDVRVAVAFAAGEFIALGLMALLAIRR